MDGQKNYQIVVTSSAERAYFEVLDYVYEHYSVSKANQIAIELLEFPTKLKSQPFIGKIELNLANRKNNYRFLLYKRTQIATVKIIYYIDETDNTIYITDYFPCEMYEQKIRKRI